MPLGSVDNLYDGFKVFQVSRDEKGDARFNQFWRVSENELLETEKLLGFSIPCQLRRFYLEIGNGHLVTNIKGEFQDDYFNIFVDLERMVKFWKRTEVSFGYDPEIIDKDELVFFDTGSYCYKVLRPFSDNPNAVYDPGDRKPISNSFNEFILKLYENTTFYLDHEGVYED